MEFIQKHWARLSVALLFLIGGILAIISYSTDSFDALNGTEDWFPFIAAILFFFGSSAVAILKIFAPKIVGLVYGIMGGVITILFTVVLATDNTIDDFGVNVFWYYIVPLLVFGVQPLVRGLIKFVEGDKVFVPAEAKPAPAPKAEPKPVAKKTAK
jgi:peptidoglycan/LPS O-acetylase OafA/YrhL